MLSALLPGLGQLYQERWVRGLILLLVPPMAFGIVGAFVFISDPLTALVVRHALLAALLIIGGLFAYHLAIVADAFVGRLGGGGLRARHAADYVLLGLVTLALIAAYGTVYREASAWAMVLSKVFEPVARAGGQPVLPNEPPPAQWSGSERLNVLLLGIDTRGPGGDTQNTDTVIVLSLDPVNKTGAMLSIPRDTYVKIPGHGSDKINSAYSYGGPAKGAELARQTVEDLLGVQIHTYALLDFEAFDALVDGVGGLLIDVKRPIRDESYPTPEYGVERVEILAGPQSMDGEQALRYARTRHDSNDFRRARRQQDVIAAFRTRLANGGIGRIPALFEHAGSVVQTNFDPANLLPLARTGLGVPGGAIRSEVLLPCNAPGAQHCELTEQNDPGGYYLFPQKAKIADLVAQLFYDPKVRQEAARVEVRATGSRNGTAKDLADRLEARGFGVPSVTEGPAARSAVVLRNTDKRYSAQLLAKQLGLQVVPADPTERSDADILVRVGTDFRGLASDLQK